MFDPAASTNGLPTVNTDGPTEDSMTLAKAAFGLGDCRDTALGTLLRMRGFDWPEELLFGQFTFIVRRLPDSFRNLEITFRDRDVTADVPLVCGLDLAKQTANDEDDYLRSLDTWIGGGSMVIATVDHWEYEPSQFHHSAHMPHHIVVHARPNGRWAVFDPYPYSFFAGAVASERFRRWVRPSALGAARFYAFGLTATSGPPRRAGELLPDIWRAQAGRNCADVLGDDPLRGARGIETVADRLDDWIASDGFIEDTTQRRRMPTTSFLEAGALRRGHAAWLRRVATVTGVDLRRNAVAVADLGRRWDMVSAVRHAYQQAAGGAQDDAVRFATRKLRQVPRLLRGLAADEREVARSLAEAAA
jgi:Butirosin biosynthesis protein H, N-terminal